MNALRQRLLAWISRPADHTGATATWSPLAELADTEPVRRPTNYQPRHAARHAAPDVDRTEQIGGVIAVDSRGVAVDIPRQTITVAAPSAVPAWVRARTADPNTFIPAGSELELTGRLDPSEVLS